MTFPSTLAARDRDIIDQVVRDRIASNESIEKRFLPNVHPTSVTRVTARLVAEGWLAGYPLVYPGKYFVPGKRTVAAYGLAQGRMRPLGPQALPTEYAVLEYTSHHRIITQRMMADEITARHPWYRRDWLYAPHCLRQCEGKTILELLRIDLGGPADHIARKCRADIQARSKAEEFRTLVQSNGFSLVVITSSKSKTARIQAALDRHLWPTGISFRLAAFAFLVPLLPRSR